MAPPAAALSLAQCHRSHWDPATMAPLAPLPRLWDSWLCWLPDPPDPGGWAEQNNRMDRNCLGFQGLNFKLEPCDHSPTWAGIWFRVQISFAKISPEYNAFLESKRSPFEKPHLLLPVSELTVDLSHWILALLWWAWQSHGFEIVSFAQWIHCPLTLHYILIHNYPYLNPTVKHPGLQFP